jgi:hypothetical protein
VILRLLRQLNVPSRSKLALAAFTGCTPQIAMIFAAHPLPDFRI